MIETCSGPRGRSVNGLAVLAVLVTAAGAAVADPSSYPTNPQPEDRILVANRIKLEADVVWSSLRMTFLPSNGSPTHPAQLRLLKVQPINDFRCMGGPIHVDITDELAVAPLDLSPFPVQPVDSFWVDMPPQDEIWLSWSFVDQVQLDRDELYLIAIEAARTDWVGLRISPDAKLVNDVDETSLVSFNGGETWLCLDTATVWGFVGKVIHPNCSPLLQVTVEPDA